LTTLPADLAEALEGAASRLGAFRELRYLADVDSTNDTVLALGASGAGEGTSVLADRQHAGRGRRGRQWFSPPGAGIYLSVLLRPKGPRSLPLLTIAAGVAVARAIHAVTALPVELKWPNDLVIGRPWRKLGGLLCEASGTAGHLDAIVVGIGINVGLTAFPPELSRRATSLEGELGRPVERALVVVECLACLAAVVESLRSGRTDGILAEWRRFGGAGLNGAPVRWVEHGIECRGLAHDIDVDGALLVDTEGPGEGGRGAGSECGRRERLISGEVIWERLSRD
jgi:BirA family biotin operon repressor/biotin-[acetyl-CoA-carboxylase] ligase